MEKGDIVVECKVFGIAEVYIIWRMVVLERDDIKFKLIDIIIKPIFFRVAEMESDSPMLFK